MKLLRQLLLMGMLFVLALLTGGLLILVHQVIPLSPWWQVAECGILLIVYGLVELSTRVNMLSLLRGIRSHSKVEAVSLPFSVYEPAGLIYGSTSLTGEEINAVSPPALGLQAITPHPFSGTADPGGDPSIYLHQDFLYSQN